MKSEIQKAKIARMIEEIDETEPLENRISGMSFQEIRILKTQLKRILEEMLEAI